MQRLAQVWLALQGAISVYFAIGLSGAGIAGLVAPIFQFDQDMYAFFGFVVPMAPTYLYFASHKVFRTRLARLQQLYADGLISKSQFSELRAQAVKWFGDRNFGNP